jgi:hypothetical protein
MERGRTVFSSMDARRPVTEGLSREEHKTLRQSIPVRKGKMKTPFVPAVFEERRHPVERPMEALSLKEKAAWLAAAERARADEQVRRSPASKKSSIPRRGLRNRQRCAERHA